MREVVLRILPFILFGIFTVPMVIAAVFFLKGKGAFMIAGYNTLSKEEQSKYDEKALCRFTGWLLLAVIFCIWLCPVGIYFKIAWLAYCGIAFLVILGIASIIYLNTGNRFRKNIDTQESVDNISGKSSMYSKASVKVVIILSGITLIGVSAMFYYGEKDPVVNIHGSGIRIRAMYGLNIDFNNITDISLIEHSMRDIGIGMRTNGYGGVGEALKGHFRSRHLGDKLLFVRANSSPVIRIERNNGKDIYLSFRNSETTTKLYHDIAHSRQKEANRTPLR